MRGFKYRSSDDRALQRDLDSLRDEFFYASHRQALNDPFEGRFDRSPVSRQMEMLGKAFSNGSTSQSFLQMNAAIGNVLDFVDKLGIFSLSKTPLSELLWSHYGGSHTGYCIEYDLQKLMEFEAHLWHRVDVEYMNEVPELSVFDLVGEGGLPRTLQKMLGSKSLAWGYESEVRILTHSIGRHAHDFRAVKAVHFGLRCPGDIRTEVMRTLAGRRVEYRQVVSQVESYLLAEVAIEDEFLDAPRYRANLAPIAEGAVLTSHLKPEFLALVDYLSKAAEVVRREPYCPEVQMVEFSPSRSTEGNPVVFVQYLREPNRWVNHYLTLTEIDEQYAALDGT